MYMPSYQIYNHKAGSVSSNYSDQSVQIIRTIRNSTHSTFKTSNFILGDRSGGRKQDPHPDEVTRKEGDRDKDTNLRSSKGLFWGDIFSDSSSYGTRFRNGWRERTLRKPAARSKSARGFYNLNSIGAHVCCICISVLSCIFIVLVKDIWNNITFKSLFHVFYFSHS